MANPSTALQDIKEEEDNISELSAAQGAENSSVVVTELSGNNVIANNNDTETVTAGLGVESAVVQEQPEIETRFLGLVLDDAQQLDLQNKSVVHTVTEGTELTDREEELLLPPLPDVETKTALIYQEEAVGNLSSVSSSATASLNAISPVFDGKTSEIDDESFDLSQALEIPTHSTTGTSLNRSSSTQSVTPFGPQSLASPTVNSPKVALKRRFSNSLLSQALNQETLLISTGTSPQMIQNGDFPLHKTSTASSGHTSSSSVGIKNKSRSNSNAIPQFSPFENSLSSHQGSNGSTSIGKKMVNIPNASHSSIYDNTNTTEVSDRRFLDLKKLIVNQNGNENGSNSSGVSSASLSSPLELTSTSHYEELFVPPTASVTPNSAASGSRSRSNSNLNAVSNFFIGNSNNALNKNPRNSVDEISDSPTLNSSEINVSKRVPLLRRASSALLRKRSLRQSTEESPDGGMGLGIVSPVNDLRVASLDLDAIARLENRNKKNLFINTNDSRPSLSSKASTTSLRSTMSSDANVNRMPSFGSKVKRGFTRIISSGNNGSRKESPVDSRILSGGLSDGHSKNNDGDTISMNFGLDTNSVNEFVEEHNGNKNNLLRKRSSSMYQQKRASRINKRSSNTNSILSDRANSSSMTNTKSKLQKETEEDLDEEDLIITESDLEALSEKLPTITITEKFGANNTTPLQQQSNVWCYKTSFDEWKNATNKKPSDASLRKYIDILIEQQMVEDTRFQALEQNFKQSGWVSSQEIGYLRQKRVIINRQWAERISFYQNKLEE
ncbi:unnamed protein product [Kluyveromyces dobzhanskii CBS 2104]|uniref:WGS project CCBQ000000000 data, contig 00012 n=1 Tax=Kluyveromyces dobzhanskii CBS 2104 TaxID=1427455 RepID=A0A0A8L2X0_9SACH|nr:unnamed protein product [Kluyveromyces dobzhanskii CBS 2104]